MIKTSFGTPIGYGTSLPAASLTSDGSLFFKTASDAGGPTGLYLYGFQLDVSAGTIGEQVSQDWRIASDLTNYLLKAGDTMVGNLSIATPSGGVLLLGGGVNSSVHFNDSGTRIGIPAGNTLAFYTSGLSRLQIDNNGVVTISGNSVWHAGNDGVGSGLDSDLLDGQQGSFYTSLSNSTGTLDINSRTSGALAVSRGGTNNTVSVQGGVLYGSSSTQLAYTSVGVTGQVLQSNGTGQPSWVNASALSSSTANSLTTARQIALSGNVTGSAMFDGSSNITIAATVNNSAQLAGLNPATTATVSTIAQRDGAGDLYARYLNQGSVNNENPAISQVMVTNGSDGFLRKASIGSLATAVAAAGLTGYVAKSGDVMSGSLTVGDQAGEFLQVNGITLNWTGSAITTSGTVSAGLFSGPGTNLSGTATSLTVGNSASLGGVAAAGYALLIGATFTGDITTYRAGAPTTGVIYLGNNSGNRYLYYDGTRYILNGAGLNVGGTMTATGDVIAYSDRKLKKNIVTIENALDKVIALRGVEFDRVEDDTHSIGVIAQEIQEVIPSLVHESEDGTLGVAYGNLVGVLIEAIKEQQKQIDVLTSRLNALID